MTGPENMRCDLVTGHGQRRGAKDLANGLWVPRILSPPATCTYLWMRPPSRSRRSGRMAARIVATCRLRWGLTQRAMGTVGGCTSAGSLALSQAARVGGRVREARTGRAPPVGKAYRALIAVGWLRVGPRG